MALEAASTILALMAKGGRVGDKGLLCQLHHTVILQKFAVMSPKAADLSFQMIECIVGTIDAATQQLNQSDILEVMQGAGITGCCIVPFTNPDRRQSMTFLDHS